MPSYSFPIAPPSPYTEKAATRPYSNRKNQPQSSFFDPTPSHDYVVVSNFGSADRTLGLDTKKSVTFARYTQLALRIAELSGVVGLLVCTACTRNLGDQQSFYLRTPPSINAVTSAYAIYHLARPATYRPAGPSSSYHFFALVIDACLIPFYIFIAFLTRSELVGTSTDDGRWTSVFDPGLPTQRLILATWFLAIIVGGIHVLTLLISSYLWLVFRQIARLPPDQNPLEAHLTSRPRKSRKTTHETAKEVNSQIDPIAFLHTRPTEKMNNSRYSPSSPATASRLNLDLPPLPMSENRTNDRTLGTHASSKASTNSRYKFSSIRSILKGSSMYSLNLYDDYNTPPLPRRSSKRRSEVLSDGVITRTGSPERNDTSKIRVSVVKEEAGHDNELYNDSAYDFSASNQHLNTSYHRGPSNRSDIFHHPQLNNPPTYPTNHLQPLHMNPPTPPPPIPRTYPITTISPSIPPRSPSRKPKSTLYGELSSVESLDLGTVRNPNTPWLSPAPSPAVRVSVKKDSTNDWAVSHSGADIGEHDMAAVLLYQIEMDSTHDGASDASSGLAYKGASGVMVNGLRGRNVSGKLAEEGRGGAGERDGVDRDGPEREEGGGNQGSWSGRWFGGRAW